MGLRPHDLRHTAVAFWIAAGASPKEIATRAGHTSVVTVLDRYGHLLPGSVSRDGRGMEPVAPLALRDAHVPLTCAFVVGDTGLEPMTSAV